MRIKNWFDWLEWILFWRLFQGGRTGGSTWKLEKLKCVLHYFQRITEKSKLIWYAELIYPVILVPNGVITFRRYQLPESCLPKWKESKEPLCKIHITKNKIIEDIDGLLQVKILHFFQCLMRVFLLDRWILLINIS